MKRLIYLFVAISFTVLFVKFPKEIVKSQTPQTKEGSIKGVVLARDKGDGKTSVLFGVENQCPNNESCEKQKIDGVTVSVDNK